MSSTQLSFTLSTKPKIDAVHLVGSWDNYKQHLPLSESKTGKWKGTFKFPAKNITPGSRYWYYYLVNNVKCVHDPNEKSTVEPSTKRTLNVLDVPRSSQAPVITQSKSSSTRPSSKSISGSDRVAKGRPISPSRIVAPKPSRPYESRAVREADYSASPALDDICDKLEAATLMSYNRNISPPSSVGSSVSSRGGSSGHSSPSSLSSLSDRASSGSSRSSSSSCRCNRFGVTRGGSRVRMDCGGKDCGYSDDSDSCSSIDSDSESESEDERVPVSKSRRGGAAVIKPRVQEIRPREGRSAASRRR